VVTSNGCAQRILCGHARSPSPEFAALAVLLSILCSLELGAVCRWHGLPRCSSASGIVSPCGHAWIAIPCTAVLFRPCLGPNACDPMKRRSDDRGRSRPRCRRAAFGSKPKPEKLHASRCFSPLWPLRADIGNRVGMFRLVPIPEVQFLFESGARVSTEPHDRDPRTGRANDRTLDVFTLSALLSGRYKDRLARMVVYFPRALLTS